MVVALRSVNIALGGGEATGRGTPEQLGKVAENFNRRLRRKGLFAFFSGLGLRLAQNRLRHRPTGPGTMIELTGGVTPIAFRGVEGAEIEEFLGDEFLVFTPDPPGGFIADFETFRYFNDGFTRPDPGLNGEGD